MAMEQSILKSTKKILGLDAEYNAFDLDVLTHINATFVTLKQLGVGPREGYMIEDADDTWEDFMGNSHSLNAVKTYIYMKVRLLFDPPDAAPHMQALESQVTELEHRLKMDQEDMLWAPQSSSLSLP